MPDGGDALFGLHSRVFWSLAKPTVGTAIRLAYRTRVHGVANVPRTGPAVLAANHVSFLDSVFVAVTAPRRVTFLGKAEYWESPLTRLLMELASQIPVHRGDATRSQAAVDAGVRVLRAGELLAVHPEGTRSPDGRLYRGRTGVARMALTAGAPVVPTGVTGTREVMPKGAVVPKPIGSVVVRFGEPMRVPADAVQDAGVLRGFVDDLMRAIAELTGQTFRNRYADRNARAASQAGRFTPSLPWT